MLQFFLDMANPLRIPAWVRRDCTVCFIQDLELICKVEIVPPHRYVIHSNGSGTKDAIQSIQI